MANNWALLSAVVLYCTCVCVHACACVCVCLSGCVYNIHTCVRGCVSTHVHVHVCTVRTWRVHQYIRVHMSPFMRTVTYTLLCLFICTVHGVCVRGVYVCVSACM